MPARSATTATATALLVILALGFAFAGVVLIAALGTGVIPTTEPAAPALTAIVAALAIGAAGAGLLFAGALWAGRPWGWAGSLAISIIGLSGALVAVATSGAQPPLLVGLALTLSTVVLLMLPATRAAAS